MNDQMTMFDMPGASYASRKGSNNPFFTSSTDEYATPQWLFDKLDAEFHFTLDPCSTDENAKCKKHYTRAQDGLKQDWSGETVWCNPPYGRDVVDWVRKCYLHATGGGDCGDAGSCQNRHGMVSRLYLREGRGPIFERTRKVWRKKMVRAVSEHDCYF